MKYLWLILLVGLGDSPVLNRVSRYNGARRQAERFYAAGQYRRAIDHYSYLINNDVADAATHLNLGHTYFKTGQFSLAKTQYATIQPDDATALVEQASIQLGILACQNRDSATALSLFRQALLRNPDNDIARYDFELIKRTWSGKRMGRANQPKPQQQLRPTAGDEVAKSTRKEQILRRIGPSGMTDEQARQLLDALPDEPITVQPDKTRPDQPGNRW